MTVSSVELQWDQSMVIKLQSLTCSQSPIQAEDLRAGIEGAAVHQSGSDAPGKQSRKGKGRPGLPLFLTTRKFE